MLFRQLFDPESSTFTYLIADVVAKDALLIDPVLEHVARDLGLVRELDLKLGWVLETHVHADHITGASALREATGAKVALSAASGVKCADRLLSDGDEVACGSLKVQCLTTPGHTDSCMSYLVGGKVFTGDVLFVRDMGRTDFQQGSSDRIFESIRSKLFSLPDSTEVFPAHDYRGHRQTTIGEEKKYNSKLGGNVSREEFSRRMSEMKLGQPKKIHVAVPANLECGKFLS